MYFKSVKFGNDLNKNIHLNYIVEAHRDECDFYVNAEIYDDFTSSFYASLVECLVTSLCENGMTSNAKIEAKNLTQSPSYVDKEWLFHLLGICSYYEDDEDKVLLNFGKFKESRYSYKQIPWQARQCYLIDEIYSVRREGKRLHDNSRYEEAIKFYIKGIENDAIIPIVSSTLFYLIACANLKLDREEEALLNLNKAIEKNSKNHEAIVAKGEYYLKRQKFSDALVNFEQASNLHPCDRYKELIKYTKLKQSSPLCDDDSMLEEISLQRKLANCKKIKGNKLYANNRYEEAIAIYSEAIELDSTNHVYFSNRAACYLELKKFSDGLKDCKKALEINCSFVKGFYRLSKCFIALGNPGDAITALEKALKLKPNDKDLQAEKLRAECLRREIFESNYAYKDDKYEIAEQILSAALSKAESCTELRLKRIDCLIKLDKFDRALTEADLAASLDRDNSELLYFMGVCHFYNQEKDKSVECLKKSILLKLDERVSEFLLSVENVFRLKLLGDKAYEENKYQIALSCYEEGLQNSLKNKLLNSGFHFKIGMIRVKQNETIKAVGHFNSAINLQPKNGEAYLQRAKCFLNLNLLHKALQDFVDLDKLAPTEEHKTLIRETKSKIEVLSNGRNEEELEKELLKLKEVKAKKYFDNKQYSEAVEHYTAALRLSENVAIYLSRSECYVEMKNYHSALSDAMEAIKSDPKCLKGLIISGNCQTLLGNANEAIFAFEQAKQLEKCNQEVNIGIKKAIKLKQCLDKAEEAVKNKTSRLAYDMYKCASRIAVGCSSILLGVAECLINLGRLPDLFKLIESVDKSLQESSEYFCMKGLESYHKDEMSNTVKYLEKALELAPSNEKYNEYLTKIRSVYEKKRKGNDAFCQQKYDDALQYYEEGLKIEKDNIIIQSKLHYNIGVILKKRKFFHGAIKEFSWAISRRKTYINALEKRAQCYVEINMHIKAIEEYQNLYKITKSESYLKIVEDLKKPLNKESAKKDYYKILKVATKASTAEIRKSYRTLAKECHPDKLRTENDKKVGEEKFKIINEAYSVLIDPLKREPYDRRRTDEDEEFPFNFDPFEGHRPFSSRRGRRNRNYPFHSY